MRQDEGMAPEGIIAVDKPEGPTSHDIVACIRRILRTRRVGHCGTLDPLASGLLLVCVGRFTRLSAWLSACDKQYTATFHLGARSDTADAQGQIVPVAGPPPVAQQLEAVTAGLTGTIDQVPPAHSAIRVDGVRSYHRARRQEGVTLPARQVRVSRFDIVEYRYPRLHVEIDCSKGTYIRSLARDLGEALGCGAYVEVLRRTGIGTVGIGVARSLDEIEQIAGCDLPRLWLDPLAALRQRLPPLELDAATARAFTHGHTVAVSAPVAGEVVVCLEHRLLGIGCVETQRLRPLRVLASPAA